MKAALLVNRVLITLFGLSSGLFKVAGSITRTGDPAAWWETDNGVFAHLGLGPTLVGLFGLVQAVAAALVWPVKTRKAGAYALAACNLFATAGLFAAGVQPFGVVSLVFVVMAVLAGRPAR
ncbi:MAG: hypothetical protein JNK82_36760 [Myxococcaceae bacterium]|nr:hypothetical protein [Myxococcaceae bacterium]